MISRIKRYGAALFATLAMSLPAAATSTGVDYTDQWWGGQAEHGWGVNFIQQGGVIFATLFVYGTDQTPRWYVATMTGSGGTFSGAMYSTTGPYFGAGAFNGDSTVATQVGTMSVSFSSAYNGALTYTVNGVGVSKSILRQSFAPNNIQGHYRGGMVAASSGCSGVANGQIETFDVLTVTQNGQSVQMVVDFFANGSGTQSRCTYNGTLTTQGVMGQIANGTFSCTVGGAAANVGTFTLDAMSMTQSGFNGSFNGRDQFCSSYTGFFGGIKDTQ